MANTKPDEDSPSDNNEGSVEEEKEDVEDESDADNNVDEYGCASQEHPRGNSNAESDPRKIEGHTEVENGGKDESRESKPKRNGKEKLPASIRVASRDRVPIQSNFFPAIPGYGMMFPMQGFAPHCQVPQFPAANGNVLDLSLTGQNPLTPCGYTDASTIRDPAPDTRRNRGGVTEPFPQKLHRMLEATEKEGDSDVVGWFSHGRAFAIHKPRKFVQEVMPRFFKQTRLTSFQRQLNLYGFSRISQGTDNGGYYHELFLQGRPGLCVNMKRTKVKGILRIKRDPGSEPNFYAYPPIHSVSDPAHGTHNLAESSGLSWESPMTSSGMAGSFPGMKGSLPSHLPGPYAAAQQPSSPIISFGTPAPGWPYDLGFPTNAGHHVPMPTSRYQTPTPNAGIQLPAAESNTEV